MLHVKILEHNCNLFEIVLITEYFVWYGCEFGLQFFEIVLSISFQYSCAFGSCFHETVLSVSWKYSCVSGSYFLWHCAWFSVQYSIPHCCWLPSDFICSVCIVSLIQPMPWHKGSLSPSWVSWWGCQQCLESWVLLLTQCCVVAWAWCGLGYLHCQAKWHAWRCAWCPSGCLAPPLIHCTLFASMNLLTFATTQPVLFLS